MTLFEQPSVVRAENGMLQVAVCAMGSMMSYFEK